MTKIAVQPKGQDLRKDPICHEHQLGLLVPPTPYALSFALPQWNHVVGYAEHEMHILDRSHQSSVTPYMHPMVRKLFREANIANSVMGEETLIFPSLREAQSCQVFLERAIEKHNLPKYPINVASFRDTELHVLTMPASVHEFAWQYHETFSEQVSPRRAAAVLNAHHETPSEKATEDSRTTLKTRLAKLSGSYAQDIYFFTVFSAALAAMHRVAQQRTPELKGFQIGYPFFPFYSLTADMEPGAHFHSWMGEEEFASLETLLEHDKLAYVICEAPCIPLMNTLDLPALSALLRSKGVPLLVDDSAATFYNVDVSQYADVVISSLGGFFSGRGESNAAIIRLCPDSPFYQELKALLEEEHDELLWESDAAALLEGSSDFNERMEQVNSNAEQLADWLHKHHGILRVYYPKVESPQTYEMIRKPVGGYGGLIHFLLRRDNETTLPFYNAVEITKALALGTPFSVLAPYTMLKFPDKLDWAEMHGVPRHLLRLSVGLEPIDEIKKRIAQALAAF